jgi:hypothetical protein
MLSNRRVPSQESAGMNEKIQTTIAPEADEDMTLNAELGMSQAAKRTCPHVLQTAHNGTYGRMRSRT